MEEEEVNRCKFCGEELPDGYYCCESCFEEFEDYGDYEEQEEEND